MKTHSCIINKFWGNTGFSRANVRDDFGTSCADISNCETSWNKYTERPRKTKQNKKVLGTRKKRSRNVAAYQTDKNLYQEFMCHVLVLPFGFRWEIIIISSVRNRRRFAEKPNADRKIKRTLLNELISCV